MKRAIGVLLSALLLLCATPVCAEDCIYISNESELVALSARVAAGDDMAGVTVYLTADIVLTAPFAPIGVSADAPFSGSFCGNGHSVSGLRVGGQGYSGLFGYVLNGSISRLSVVSGVVSGDSYCALLVGRLYAYGGTASVSDCAVSGTVSGESYVGGLVGYAGAAAYGVYAAVELNACTASAEVSGDMYVGGVLGRGDVRSTSSRAVVSISGCRSYGAVSASGRYGSVCGGICGAVGAEANGGSCLSTVSDCVSYSSVIAELSAAGGACGATGADGFGAETVLERCVAFGTVTSAALTGGICGKCETANSAEAAVKDCVSAGSLIGSDISLFASGADCSGCTAAVNGNAVYPDGAEPPVYSVGDANGDGASNSLDAALLLKFDAGIAILGAAALAACDLNGDGALNSIDAALLLKFDAGNAILGAAAL